MRNIKRDLILTILGAIIGAILSFVLTIIFSSEPTIYITDHTGQIILKKTAQNVDNEYQIRLDENDLAFILSHKTQSGSINIEMTEFKKNRYISGKIHGLAPSESSKYRILVYVLTDKWYIHPWAENIAGRGYANINSDGTWEIGTIWRGYQAYRLAFLLTEHGIYPPATVNVNDNNPDKSLLSKISTSASLIIEAPEGI